MIILDSNIWIALFTENDSQHKKALTLFDTITTRVGIPEYVFIEVCSVLVIRASKETANTFIDTTQKNSNAQIIASDEQFLTATIDYFVQEPHPGLSFIDVSLLYLSRTHTVLTFDEQLGRAIKKSV